jgi:hypothetical protein
MLGPMTSGCCPKGDIYIRDSGTGEVTQLSNTAETESSPMLSADAKTVVFSRKQDGTEDVFELVIGSQVVTAVASGSGDQTRPIYADRGAIVYFDGARGEGMWDLAMVPSSGVKPLTLARDVRLPTRSRPALSPDGKWVAYGLSDPTKDDAIYLSSLGPADPHGHEGRWRPRHRGEGWSHGPRIHGAPGRGGRLADARCHRHHRRAVVHVTESS